MRFSNLNLIWINHFKINSEDTEINFIGNTTELKMNHELSNEFKIVLAKFKIKNENGIFKVSKSEEDWIYKINKK